MVIDELTCYDSFDPLISIGIVGIQQVLEIEKRGIRVYLTPPPSRESRKLLAQHYPAFLPIADRPSKPTEWGLCHAFPPYLGVLDTPKKILHTTFETTRIPRAWAEMANAAEAVIVPSDALFPYLRESGVTKPLYQVVDPVDETFTYHERSERDTFTFLCYGSLRDRKMPIETITAWRKAFPDEPDVRLIMKSMHHVWGMSRQPGTLRVDDPRITIIDAAYTVKEIGELCHQADAGLFLSRGEANFLSPQELALTGATSLVPGHSGCASWAREDCFYVVGLDAKRPHISGLYPGWGEFFNMDMESVVDTLRHMYDHRDEVREKGQKAADWIRSRFTVKQSVDQLVGVLKKVEDENRTRLA